MGALLARTSPTTFSAPPSLRRRAASSRDAPVVAISSYRNYKIFYEFYYPPPRFLVKMFSRNFSYQDKEKSEPVMPGAKISSTMSPQHSFTVLFSRNKKDRDRSYPQLRSLSFLFKPFISQYDCRTHHGNLSLLCYRHYSRAHVLLYDDRCLCRKCGLPGNGLPPGPLQFPV